MDATDIDNFLFYITVNLLEHNTDYILIIIIIISRPLSTKPASISNPLSTFGSHFRDLRVLSAHTTMIQSP